MPIPAGALVVDATSSGDRMILTVDTTGVPSGELLVWGETPDQPSWWVRGARGGTVFESGEVIFLVDPLAPLNVPITYHFRAPDGDEAQTYAVQRSYTGWHLLTNLQGSGQVDVFRHQDGDARSYGLRQATFDVPGRTRPVIRYGTTTAGGTQWEIRTSGETTAAFKALLMAGEPVIMLHNPAKCPLALCDVELAEVGLMTSISSVVSDGMHTLERVWTIGFTFVDDPLADIITPLSTVADFDAYWAGLTVSDHDVEWAGRTVADHARTVWSA